MSNADLTVRILSGIGAIGALYAFWLLARSVTKDGAAPRGLIASAAFISGVLVYALARVFSGPSGPDTTVRAVAFALFACGAAGIYLAKRAARTAGERESEAATRI